MADDPYAQYADDPYEQYADAPATAAPAAPAKQAQPTDAGMQSFPQPGVALGGGGAHLGEVARDAYEGVAQIASHLYDTVTEGKWTGSTTTKMTQQENARRAAYDKANNVNPYERSNLDIASTLPLAAVPGPGSESFLANVALQAAHGAATGASVYSPTAENAKNGALAAAFASGLSAVASAAPAMYNWAKGKVANALNQGNWKEAYSALQEALPNWKFDLGQMTDNPTIVNYLRGAPSPVKQKFWADQSDAVLKDMQDRLAQNGVAGNSTNFLADTLQHTQSLFDSHVQAATLARSNAWQSAVSSFEKDAEPLGSIATPTLYGKADELLAAEQDKIRNPGGFNIGAGVKNALSDIKNYLAPPPPPLTTAQQQIEVVTKGMSAASRRAVYDQAGVAMPASGGPPTPQLQMNRANDALVGIRKIMESDDPQARQLGGQLFDSLLTDLKAGAGNSPALQDLMDLRNAYKQHSANIQAMKDSATATILGAARDESKIPVSGQDIFRNFAGAKPEQQAEAIDWIRRNNPEAIPQIRTKLVQDAVQSATAQIPTGISSSSANLTDLGKSLTQMGQYQGLWSPEELKTINAMRGALGAIKRTNTGGIASTGSLADTSNVYSIARAAAGSPTFALKLAAKFAGKSKQLEQSILNPNMQYLASRIPLTPGVKQQAARQALLAYMSNASDSGEFDKQEQQQ
jgi:hypothetical protein